MFLVAKTLEQGAFRAAEPRPVSSGLLRVTTGRGAGPSRGGLCLCAGAQAERPIAHLEGFRGVLQVDGYAGYRALADRGDLQLAFCWSHVRRGLYELAATGPAPIASEALARIASLYAVEAEIRGQWAEARRAVRQDRSRPVIEALEPWLRAPGLRPSARRASSPKRSVTRCLAGRGSPGSWTMAASSSTPTPSSARSGPSLRAVHERIESLRTPERGEA